MLDLKIVSFEIFREIRFKRRIKFIVKDNQINNLNKFKIDASEKLQILRHLRRLTLAKER